MTPLGTGREILAACAEGEGGRPASAVADVVAHIERRFRSAGASRPRPGSATSPGEAQAIRAHSRCGGGRTRGPVRAHGATRVGEAALRNEAGAAPATDAPAV